MRIPLLPLIAALGLAFAIWRVAVAVQPTPAAAPAVEPPVSPFSHHVAGAGMVEALGENTSVAAPVNGVVETVAVTAGTVVAAGDLLFILDRRAAKAAVEVAAAEAAAAGQRQVRLKTMPRPEDLPVAAAKVAEAAAAVADAEIAWNATAALADPAALSREERSRREQALAAARSRLAAVTAEQQRLTAGTWAPELAVSAAELAAAQARLDQAKTELEILSVRAPVPGTVLAVRVRAGERAEAGGVAPILLGDLSRLQVRVDVDENDAWRIRPGAKARATARGNPVIAADLAFLRFEPFVVPKKSLTGEATERVDTRVLQVIFTGERSAQLRPGQLVDVVIAADPLP
ncbi:glycosyl hydrolase family 18 [Planctomycetota bacterium]|nr:glycosyl hydrolase family 18 [Planctomycetota bacterium]